MCGQRPTHEVRSNQQPCLLLVTTRTTFLQNTICKQTASMASRGQRDAYAHERRNDKPHETENWNEDVSQTPQGQDVIESTVVSGARRCVAALITHPTTGESRGIEMVQISNVRSRSGQPPSSNTFLATTSRGLQTGGSTSSARPTTGRG
jgi:hypothetical protein